MSESPILCLLGPTAVGKSHWAMIIAEAIDAEIISVDSAMIYRGMNIGTAKPTHDECARVRHHLLDIRDPSERYNVGDFCLDALQSIKEIRARGKRPLLVGGTMMYFQAFWFGLADLPAQDQKIRQRLESEALEFGWAALHLRLQQVDPISARRIEPTDPQRIQRALEVYELTGKPLSQFHSESQVQGLWSDCQSLAIVPEDRSVLHKKIATRFREMCDAGFIEEVESLYRRGDLNENCPSVRSVGYRQAWSYLQNEYGYEEMISRAIIATRQLAKRQLTWIKSWKALATLKDTEISRQQLLAWVSRISD